MPAPVLVSIAAKDRTLIYTYDQDLDDSFDGDVGDFAITSSGSPASFTENSLVTFGKNAYLGVAELMPVALITTNYNGGSDILNLAGEAAPAIINQNAVNTSTGTDTTAPTPVGGTIDGLTARIYFSEVLDAASIPAAAQFNFITDDGTTIAGTGAVLVYGNRVTVTLASAVDAGDVVALNYTQPGANPLRDPSANKVASIYSLLLTNRSSAVGIYANENDIEDIYGAENVRQWSQLNNEVTEADKPRIARVLDYVDAWINFVIGKAGYVTPIDESSKTFLLLKEIAALMAGVKLYRPRGWVDEGTDPNGKMKGNRQEAIDKLEDLIADGIDGVLIDGGSTAGAGGGIAVVSADPANCVFANPYGL